MKLWRRLAGIALLYGILAVASYNGAHAAEPDPTCIEAMTPEAGAVNARRVAGLSSVLNRWLIRTDPHYGDQGRWILLRFLDALEYDAAADQSALLAGLCALPVIPAAAPLYRSEFDKPKDI